MTNSATNSATPAPAEGTPSKQEVQPIPPVQGAPAAGNQNVPIVTPADKPGDAGAKTGEPAKAEEATPAPYDLTAPDGGGIEDATVKEFAQSAHRNGITKDAAQKILDDLAPSIAARAQENVKTKIEEWKAASAADKRFGGNDKQAAVDARIDRGLAKLGSDEFRKLVDINGLRHHPEFRAFLAAAGDAVSEDSKVVQPAPARGIARVNGMMTPEQAAKIAYGRS